MADKIITRKITSVSDKPAFSKFQKNIQDSFNVRKGKKKKPTNQAFSTRGFVKL